MNGRQDLKSSGGMKIAGGEYGMVRVSGALKVEGTLDCEEMHASGAVKTGDDLRCAGKLSASGAVRAAGSIQSGCIAASGALEAGGELSCKGALHNSGSLSCGGKLTADEVKASGACRCGGDVRVRELVTSGRFEAANGVEAERFRSSGKLEIKGLLNAEEVDISLCTNSSIGDIGGSRIRVRRDCSFGISFGKPHLDVKSIEGDTVELELTNAEVVRGRFVRIGAGCNIGRVEYTEDLTVEGGTVREQVKNTAD